MDFSRTLNLPRTDFPMKANLPKREPEILAFWQSIGLYEQVQKRTSGRPQFILHDGPPYANGHIHLGTSLNKILKDFIVKFHSLAGYDAPYVPGWDTHGLPIEQQAIKDLGIDRHSADLLEFRRHCREYALKFVGIQKEEFKRLGVRGDWDHPYLTLDPEYEAVQIGIFGSMAEKGYIYKGLKPVYWCADCETALAEAEVEYQDHQSPSIYVKFPIIDAKGRFETRNSYVVIWTTTPWTLPANLAVAVNPTFTYVLVRVGEDLYLVAKELCKRFLEVLGASDCKVEKQFLGSELEGIKYISPLNGRECPVILGDHVTLEQGTGCVHTAPGHGLEDYEVGVKYGLPILSPVDSQGRFTDEVKDFAGMPLEKANRPICEALERQGQLLHFGFIQHQYPHCWRCKSPVFFRATEQWFASVQGFRQEALQAIRKVKWIPAWGEERISKMMEDRSDWCISRQRVWGVPIPIFYCQSCGEEIISRETISHLQQLFKDYGSDIWFSKTASELLPPGFTCPKCGSREFNKEKDTMDVWFDSGSSHAAVLKTRPELRWPADLYLEGSDQHRGWFNSSLSTSVATSGQAPYRAVLTHGYVVDEQGRKMSKSLGNGIDPMDVVEQMGADVLRLWVASADYRRDVAASPGIMRQMVEAYRKIRNTCRFLLGNLYDFDPQKDRVEYGQLQEIDKWALLRLHKLITRVTKAYEDYEFHVVYHAVHRFCVTDMSAFYLDIIKDRLYTTLADSQERRAAQTVLYDVIHALVRMLAPILAFTTEEIWQHLRRSKDPVSIQLTDWPKPKPEYIDQDLEERWNSVLELREHVSRAIEQAKEAHAITNALQARVDLYPLGNQGRWLELGGEGLATVFIVSKVVIHSPSEVAPEGSYFADDLGVAIVVSLAEGEKCERCWLTSETVGTDPEYASLCQRCAGVVKAYERRIVEAASGEAR